MKIRTQLILHISLSLIIFLSLFITKDYWNELKLDWSLYPSNPTTQSNLSYNSESLNKLILYSITIFGAINMIIALIISFIKPNIQKPFFYTYFAFLAIGAVIFTFVLPFNLENSIYQDVYFTEPIDKETTENYVYIAILLESKLFYLSLIFQFLGILLWFLNLIKINKFLTRKLNY